MSPYLPDRSHDCTGCSSFPITCHFTNHTVSIGVKTIKLASSSRLMNDSIRRLEEKVKNILFMTWINVLLTSWLSLYRFMFTSASYSRDHESWVFYKIYSISLFFLPMLTSQHDEFNFFVEQFDSNYYSYYQ